jgi:hypothetical protein
MSGAPMDEPTGTDRIADAIAEDGRNLLQEFGVGEEATEWAEKCRTALQAAFIARNEFREYTAHRTAALSSLRELQSKIPAREGRKRFERIIQRIARATRIADEEMGS